MSSKVVIKPETAVEQQEILKNVRRGFKVLQKTSKDKENLVGRQSFGALHKGFVKSKSANELNDGEFKRKKLVAHSVQTTGDDRHQLLSQVIEDCAAESTDDPASEHYWKHQAEKQRLALEAHLRENERLHGQVSTLKDQLDEANRLLTDSRSLTEVLSELLQESEASGEPEHDLPDAAPASEEDGSDEPMVGAGAAAEAEDTA